jgi:DNA-binding beta-propeller fold protein YncE
MKAAAVLFAVCCWLSAAHCQDLETVIMLPDTLGPLNGPYHLACTDDPAFPRLYIGGESDSGGVIVANAIKYKRLARIPTGPVKALCYVARHNKLYVACLGTHSVKVVDCGTNQVASTVHVASEVPVMQYNIRNDRLYCGGSSVSVIDCAADTMVRTIPVAATVFALDSAQNKLYAGDTLSPSPQPLAVVDCAGDSVVTTIACLDSTGALYFNPAASKVYATSGDTLYAILASNDSVVARLPIAGLLPHLACDPQRNRIYSTLIDGRGPFWTSIDCSVDTVIMTVAADVDSFLACHILRDRIYCGSVEVYQASTGQCLGHVSTGGPPSGWSQSLDRLYCVPYRHQPPQDIVHEGALLTVVAGAGDSVVGIIPLTMCAGQVTLDTVHNRLYFVYQTASAGCVGAVDCSRNIVTWYRYAGVWTTAICYNPNNDRLYWATCTDHSSNSVVTVFDCATELVVKRIPIGGEIFSLKLHEGLNKLCVYSSGCDVSIIDCNRDTLVTNIPLAPNYPRPVLLVPEDNRFWYLGVYDVVVVDLVGDTVVTRAADTLRSIDDACACPNDRKIYTSLRQVIDMDNPAHVESIPFAASRYCYVPSLHKLYGCCNRLGPPPPPGDCIVRVLDTRSDTVTASFFGPRMVSGMCLDHTGNYIYCAVYADSTMFVIDVRGDSVLSMFGVPTEAAARDPLVANRRTDRIYEAQYDVNFGFRGIPVVRDSMPIGLEELVSTERRPGVSPTLVSRSAPLRASVSAELYDASGRRVAALRQGLNDISQLVPGVYFLREAQAQAQATEKLVIAR